MPVTPGIRIVFPMHSRWDRMQSYFADAGAEGVVFDVIDPGSHLIVGRACFDTSALIADASAQRQMDAAPLTLTRTVPIFPCDTAAEKGAGEGETNPADVPQEAEDNSPALGHLHLKVMVRLGALSVVKRVLQDKLLPRNGGVSPIQQRRGVGKSKRRQRRERFGPDAPSPSSDFPPSPKPLTRMAQVRARQAQPRDVTGLMLPSMLSSFQLNEVLAENDTSSLLERFPPTTTEHFQPATSLNLQGADGAHKSSRTLSTSWSDPRPLFAAAALFASAAEAEEAEDSERQQLGDRRAAHATPSVDTRRATFGSEHVGHGEQEYQPVATTNTDAKNDDTDDIDRLPIPPPPPRHPWQEWTAL